MAQQLRRGEDELDFVLRALNRLYREMSPSRTRRPNAPAGMRYLTQDEIKAREARAKADAEYAETVRVAQADVELRQEIMDAMTAKGISPRVALNLTDTTAKMLAAGKQYNII